MRKVLILLLLLLACTRVEKDSFDFSLRKGEVQTLDSLWIDEEGMPFGLTFNEKLYQDSLLVLGDMSFRSVHVFNTQNGKLIRSFNSESIQDYPLPESSYSNSFISGDSIYLLNHYTNHFFSFSIDGIFQKRIEFELDDRFRHTLQFESLFERVGNEWFISTQLDAPLSEAFRSSEIVSVFDEKGKFQRSFGRYPESYSQGKLVLGASENILIKNGRLYHLSVAGKPTIKIYSLEGELLEAFTLPSYYFNPEIGFYTADPFEASLTDQITNFATDFESDEQVFYYTFSTYKIRDPDQGLLTTRKIIAKLDMAEKIVTEVELLGPEYLYHVRELIPQVHGDTLHYLLREQDENLYLKRFLFKE